jgi:hypothetical protein
MALADYFQRSAVAAAQVLRGYDEDRIRERLGAVSIGLLIGPDAETPEGAVLAEMLVRLVARLYPRISIRGSTSSLSDLALRINPVIEITEGDVDFAIALGGERLGENTIYAGSDGWDALVSSENPCRIGSSSNPFGAAAAACLAAANLFRGVFEVDDDPFDKAVTFSTLDLESRPTTDPLDLHAVDIGPAAVLVGAGAIGNAAAWVLGKLPAPSGELFIVDPEDVELSNLQRYVLCERSSVGETKVELLSDYLRHEAPRLTVTPAPSDWARFVEKYGYLWEAVLVALDSARDRRSVQASLPKWIANAWTQTEDLGVSVHPWGDGACLNCIYIPNEAAPSEDALVARALGLGPEHELRVRELLFSNAPPPTELLDVVAANLDVSRALLTPFESRPIRELYVEGVCGGAIVSLDRGAPNDPGLHVPVAHQSALAGILLVASAIARSVGRSPETSRLTRIDLMKRLSEFVTLSAQKDPRGICICQDPIYSEAFGLKYGE